MMSFTHILNQKETNNTNGQHFTSCITLTNELSLNSTQTQSLQTCDYESVSQESEYRKNMLSLPIITGPNGSSNDSSNEKPENADSENSVHSYHKSKGGNEWEILEGLKDGQRCEEKPNKFDGYLYKRRKWPLKGWHKRYFNLENGILSYSKNPNDMMKGKIHGSVDVGLSVISTKRNSKRIDIDAEEFIYHIKVKNRIQFMHWVAMLRHHRLYRQHEITFGNRINAMTPIRSPVVGTATSTPIESNSKVFAWIMDSNNERDYNQSQKELSELQVKLVKLSSLLKTIEMQTCSQTNNIPDSETASLKKHRRRFLLRRKKGNNSNAVKKPIEIIVSNNDGIIDKNVNTLKPLPMGHHLSSSHPVLNDPLLQPNSLPESWSNEAESDFNEHSSDYNRLTPTKALFDFINLANDVNNSFRTLLRSIQSDNSKKGLKQFSDNFNTNSVHSLRQSLTESLRQNREMKLKLDRIHEASKLSLITPQISPETDKITRATSITSITEDEMDEQTIVHQPLAHSTSRESSSVLSISEYFDAEENLSACTTSTEDEDEESIATDLSDDGTEYRNVMKASIENISISNRTGRRSKLPAPQPDSGDVSLWSLLCKNIGKDLSKISMPVTINEPLNVLQRLCEELEYSELLDKASVIEDDCQRMLQIAAFAVSSYSSAYYRAGHKPFNPLLGETFECIREDKGFKFISEQVSHHPPVSACHAESEKYVFWQDMRIKSKFWGKSMEIIPFGTVHLYLKPFKKHYKWNKVTTCVHNLFKGQRWVDNYGELTITDGELTCKLTFEKASYWSNKKHEINGSIENSRGETLERLFGKWNESLHCGSATSAKCIWRPGAMPHDYELYYGFSRFAIELNELTPELVKVLPPTDTRFRPDQRLLEEGNIQMAETIKLQLEQQQRERRKKREESGQSDHNPLWFRKEITDEGEESYRYNERYWQIRNENGFSAIEFEKLW